MDKLPDSPTADELLQSHINHFQNVRKRWAAQSLQAHSVKHLAQTHCRISVTGSDTSMHQLIVIYLTVFSQSASPLCQQKKWGWCWICRSQEEHMQQIARFKPWLAMLLPSNSDCLNMSSLLVSWMPWTIQKQTKVGLAISKQDHCIVLVNEIEWLYTNIYRIDLWCWNRVVSISNPWSKLSILRFPWVRRIILRPITLQRTSYQSTFLWVVDT